MLVIIEKAISNYSSDTWKESKNMQGLSRLGLEQAQYQFNNIQLIKDIPRIAQNKRMEK